MTGDIRRSISLLLVVLFSLQESLATADYMIAIVTTRVKKIELTDLQDVQLMEADK